ncbi:MAG: hypothetical protein GY817_04620 [bacterium]|nr:hypothetical protein [bacterium]
MTQKIKIINTDTKPYHIANIAVFYAGENEISDEVWQKIKDSELIKKRIDRGILKVLSVNVPKLEPKTDQEKEQQKTKSSKKKNRKNKNG